MTTIRYTKRKQCSQNFVVMFQIRNNNGHGLFLLGTLAGKILNICFEYVASRSGRGSIHKNGRKQRSISCLRNYDSHVCEPFGILVIHNVLSHFCFLITTSFFNLSPITCFIFSFFSLLLTSINNQFVLDSSINANKNVKS